jgi:hypothetical protein
MRRIELTTATTYQSTLASMRHKIVAISTQIVILIISIVGGIAAGAIGAVQGPVVKNIFDRRFEAAALRDRYSPPLLQSAFDLQSRLYNIVRGRFLQTYMGDVDTEDDLSRYAEDSTLWLLGQYLGWVEILRREIQFLDFGKQERNRALREALGNVASELATDRRNRTFAVFRTTQRAIGELMIVETEESDGSKRTVCLSFLQFVQRRSDAAFERWFEPLRDDLKAISNTEDYERLIRVQRALVGVIDMLDPDRIGYPQLDTRGKLPLPVQELARSERDRGKRVARFAARASEYGYSEDTFPLDLLTAWAKAHRLRVEPLTYGTDLNSWAFGQRRPRVGARLILHAVYENGWMEIYSAASPPGWARLTRVARSNLPLVPGGWRFRISRRRARAIANDLLVRLERPSIR